ncbi:uncharacterized protein BCR38DRAFT_329834 [Pseudomassariella vexata]|uniref:Uncharacterized protein n=1 Tax=Pseudomassariella vexata TaxID=1141098 RepID=A0A1Y2EID9_9PEZI|nr:uncharacterized protein BCR38DRAFT_329834 [Pseudomassariella vexata]ORY71351.1 hypothetical protein BCR38DRAFT_329834 [Pseudomassariella vexata]
MSKPESQAKGVIAFGQQQIDRVIAPSTRQKAYSATADFATEKPVVFAFLASQVLFSFVPLLLFTCFALSTVVFALVSAVIFSLFWIGVAMLVLVPTLFVTFSVGVLVWLWVVATLLVGRWVYNMIPVNARGDDMAVQLPNGKQTIYQDEDQVNGHGHESDHGDVKSETTEIKE